LVVVAVVRAVIVKIFCLLFLLEPSTRQLLEVLVVEAPAI
jgi:hypothetical protein